MSNGYGVLWILTPSFNRQRIKRNSIDVDTPFILAVVEDPKELDIVTALYRYDDLDLWRVCARVGPYTLGYFSYIGNEIKVTKKLNPTWLSMASEFKRNRKVTHITSGSSLVTPN